MRSRAFLHSSAIVRSRGASPGDGCFARVCWLTRLWTKDPLIEYKNEGDMFLEMMTNMRRNVISDVVFQPANPQGPRTNSERRR